MVLELEGNNVNVTSIGPNGWWDVPMYNEQCGFSTGESPSWPSFCFGSLFFGKDTDTRGL